MKIHPLIPGQIVKHIIIVCLFAFVLASCTEKEDPPDYYVNTPIAGFSWSGNDGSAPVTVQFNNSSENADQFEWNFGDGGTSNEREPQHTYHNSSNEAQNFTVILKATDSATGLFQRKSRVIVVQPGS